MEISRELKEALVAPLAHYGVDDGTLPLDDLNVLYDLVWAALFDHGLKYYPDSEVPF